MRNFLRRLLGLDADVAFLTRKFNHDLDEVERSIRSLGGVVGDLNRNVRIQNQAIGRVIAKVDPMYGKPETPPVMTAGMSAQEWEQRNKEWEDRKSESDRLGQEAIDRLFAEQDARDRSYPSGTQGTR